MLAAVRLQDFKNHLDTGVRLGRLTCLVGPNGCGKTSVLEAIQFACTTAFLLSPSISHLRTPSYSPDEIPRLSPDGATLASVVAYLITTEPERFTDLVARIRAVVPAVERLRVRPARIELTEPTTITVNRKEIPYSWKRVCTPRPNANW